MKQGSYGEAFRDLQSRIRQRGQSGPVWKSGLRETKRFWQMQTLSAASGRPHSAKEVGQT